MRPIAWLSLSSTLLLHVLPCAAQQSTGGSERVTLQSRVARAESGAGSQTAGTDRRETEMLRSRLRDGDFHPGDRVKLWVSGEPELSNTFTVRAANEAGIENLTLLEEPAAAFYAWIAGHLARSNKELFDGQVSKSSPPPRAY